MRRGPRPVAQCVLCVCVCVYVSCTAVPSSRWCVRGEAGSVHGQCAVVQAEGFGNAPCNVHSMVGGERDHVSQLLSPPLLVHQGRVQRTLARVRVHPAPTRVQVHLRPHVVGPVPHVPRTEAGSAAAAGERVGPLPTPAAARSEKGRGLVVAREPGQGSAGVALVHLGHAGKALALKKKTAMGSATG